MALSTGDTLGDGWSIERLSADGTARFVRSASVDRRRAVGRLIVMAGCLAVAAALGGATAQSHDSLWLITWSLIALFGATAVLAAAAAVKDLRRASLGVFLEVDVAAGRFRGVVDRSGLRQFEVATADRPWTELELTLVPFEGSSGAGMLVCEGSAGERLLAPDLPRVEDARPWLEAVRRRRNS